MTSASAYALDPVTFRTQFPAFADQTLYPDATLNFYFGLAGNFINNTKWGPLSCQGATPEALSLMTAHLLQIGLNAAAGEQSGLVVGATIDKVTVQLQEVPVKNQWQYWLSSTPYGATLLALLQVKSTGGFYVPGGSGRTGFSDGFNYGAVGAGFGQNNT